MGIKELRLKRKLKQQDIADQLGISRAAVSKWEAGTSFPRFSQIAKLAKILKCPVAKLFE